MRIIRLTDGTEYPVDNCGALDGVLYVNVLNKDLLGLVLIFGNAEKTAVIVHEFEGTNTDRVEYVGYTELTSAAITSTGTRMSLRKAVN